VALMMHETGHTFSLYHVDDESAVMNPINTCSINFRSQSRAQIKNYVQANAGSFGCSCAQSAPVSPPPPPPPPLPVEEPSPIPEAEDIDVPLPEPEPEPEPVPVPAPPAPPPAVECQLLGKQGCKSTAGCFRFKKKCRPTAGNGAVCEGLKKKLCRRTLCLWAPPAAALEMPRLPQRRKRMKKKGGNMCRTPPTRG